MPPLVLVVDDCRAAYDRMRARGVEFTQEPVERYGAWTPASAIRPATAGR